MFKTTILALSLAIGFGANLAQALELRTKGDVPFAFYVGRQKFAPGNYSLRTGDTSGMISIRNSAKRHLGFAQTNACYRNGNIDKPVLVFKIIGGVYFLDRVWFGAGDGRQFLVGPMERELTRTSRQVARVQLDAARVGN